MASWDPVRPKKPQWHGPPDGRPGWYQVDGQTWVFGTKRVHAGTVQRSFDGVNTWVWKGEVHVPPNAGAAEPSPFLHLAQEAVEGRCGGEIVAMVVEDALQRMVD